MNSCELDAEGHCITCSDEALPARVQRVDCENGLALVTIEGSEAAEEVDITLVDDIAPGDVVLVHGGVAIAQIEQANT
jgi:hydrogenase maturation factor